MKLRSKAVRLIFGILAATLVLGGPGIVSAHEDDGRRLDLEVGGFAILGIESDTTIDDTWGVGVSGALELNSALDFEFGAFWGPGEEPDSSDTEDNVDLYNVGAGIRWYPNSEPAETIRAFLNVGVSVFFNLKGEGSEPTGAYFGPGFRMQLGESSGIVLDCPVWVSLNGQTDTILMPGLAWYYSF